MRKLDRQDWENMIEFCKSKMQEAESTYLINAKLLKFAKEEADKCPIKINPLPQKKSNPCSK